MSKPFCPFPPDFLWGVATSAYQIEGAPDADGRTPSVWDTFSRRPGAVLEDQTGDRATDHYRRFKEDVALMKALGVKAYRFSVSWSRVVPDATGKVNERGVDFYRRLIDELLSAGIAPWMTLFHWDLPQWIEDQHRGWESRDCARLFADYATAMTKRVGDKVAGVFTINEFACFLDAGYQPGEMPSAPGKVVSRKALNQSRHHALLAHGMAVQAIRATASKRLAVGLAENIPNIAPIRESAADIAATRAGLRELTGMFLTPILEGAYPATYLEDTAADAPSFTDADMGVISTPLDFVGLNLYAPIYIRADDNAKRGWSIVPCDPAYPRMHMPWLNIGPSILYWGPRLVHELWKVPAIYITENGCAYPDRLTPSGEILDTARVMYLQQHLIHLHRATDEAIPVKGYFLWSLLDNFEWAYGYTRRFGIHYVNYETMQRTPKLSARFYADVIRRNAVGGE